MHADLFYAIDTITFFFEQLWGNPLWNIFTIIAAGQNVWYLISYQLPRVQSKSYKSPPWGPFWPGKTMKSLLTLEKNLHLTVIRGWILETLLRSVGATFLIGFPTSVSRLFDVATLPRLLQAIIRVFKLPSWESIAWKSKDYWWNDFCKDYWFTTVDGRNPAPPQHVWHTVNNKVFTISTGAGFLPSTVGI